MTGRWSFENSQGEAGERGGGPSGEGEELQRGRRGCDEGGGDIAHVLVLGAGAVCVVVRRGMLGGCVLLHGTASGRFFPLRHLDAAPAHRQADAEGEDEGCEAGEHAE